MPFCLHLPLPLLPLTSFSTRIMNTSRLKFVRLTEDHLFGYHAIMSDKTATRWSPVGHCTTLQDSKIWMSELLLSTDPDDDNFAVILRSDIDLDELPENSSESTVLQPGGMIGWVGTWKTNTTPEIGFVFHREAWGHGFATEALQALTIMFWEMKPQYDTLDAWCDSQNATSISALTKSGFVLEAKDEDHSFPSLRNRLCFRAKRTLKVNLWCLAR